MKRQAGSHVIPSSGSQIFVALERFFRSKGHDPEESTALAYEAIEELESWYEEKMEGEE